MLKVLPCSTESFAKSEAGGKGYNLYIMTRHGLPIPKWTVLGKRFFAAFLAATGMPLNETLQRYQRCELSAGETSRLVEGMITGAELPSEINEAIAEAWTQLGQPEAISVRSSAADEDSASFSFAGQLSSFLYVKSVGEAAECVKRCWASAFSERALVYRKENGLELTKASIAIVLQEMVDPEVSGVLFTCDPAAKSFDHYVVSAVYGVGEGLVSGALDADSYWLDAKSGETIRREIAEKTEAFRRSESGGCIAVPVAAELQQRPALDVGLLREVFRAGQSLQKLYGRAQDIEWAVKDGRLFVLQTRPVTAAGVTGFANLWDNSNIVESYGGVTLPLSFTFALNNYHNVYVQFCEILGVPQSVVKDMDYYLRNMLGSINGRVYYNLYNWYKLVGVLPGFKQNRQFMETMMGVREQLSGEIADRIQPHPSWNTWLGKLRKVRTGAAFFFYHLTIQGIVDRFLRDFKAEYERYRALDYQRMTSDQIFSHYLTLDRLLMSKWKAPIINDFLVMFHFGLLRKLTSSWLQGASANIQNDLLAGEGNLESAEPTRALVKLAAKVQQEPALRELVEKTDAADLWEALRQSRFKEVSQEVDQYIERFGFRCMSEMKLEEIDLFSNPRFLFVCLKNYLRQGKTSLAPYQTHERELRETAERTVREQLPPWKKAIYFWVLKHARKGVRNRENTRFSRTRAYGIARSMFQAMGEDLAGRGVLAEPRDIFYLELDEVYGIHQGTLTVADLKELVVLRKRECAKYSSEEPKVRFLTRGPVYWGNEFLLEDEQPEIELDKDYDLQGTPCCPGVVEREVRVVLEPGDNMELNGEILVAPRTDPGWVPLYPSCSGLLVERGSLLSHSAIVAREMGLPAIVSIKGLTRTLKSGMVVRMDGQSGSIKIIS